jgi:hypothetical protein
MFKIAHRGNLEGPNQRFENEPSYIIEALNEGFDVEVDVWLLKDKLYLGHDIPEYLVGLNFLKNDKFWCHCKNIEALQFLMKNNVRCFFHDTDDATLTSDGYIWTYPGKHLTENSICVMPERANWNVPKNIAGVCSDYVLNIEGYIR